MQIEGTRKKKVYVDVSPKELCTAVEECRDISLKRLTKMLYNKLRAELHFNNGLFIKDGWWWLTRRDRHDQGLLPLKKRQATESEIEIWDAIENLSMVLMVDKLKR